MLPAPIPSVAAAKVTRPGVRPETVVRDRVVREVAAATARPLTVLAAPAGFGKTTALVSTLEVTGARAGWVSLGPAENDPRRLAAHVVAALRTPLGAAMDAAVRAVADGADLGAVVLPAIARALQDGPDERVLLVLDDLQAVTDPAALAFVAQLADHLPTGVGVVVASRTRPPLHLARRIAAGTATVVGPDVLAFRGAEAELFLNGALGLGLAPAELARLEARVEGWAVGLALAAHALDGGADRDAVLSGLSHAHGHLGGYLAEEVLEALPPAMLRFLRRTSVLPRLNGPLCEAVTRDPGAHELLRRAREQHLFLASDVEGEGWLRYHPVFAGLLAEQLDQADPGLRGTIHDRASRWCASHGMLLDAIHHAAQAGDGHRAGRLVLEAESQLLRAGRYAELREAIEGLPPDRGAYGPFCLGLHALTRLLEGDDPRTAEPVWEALERHRDAPGVAPLVDQALIWPFYGQLGRSVQTGRRAYDLHRDGPPALWHSTAAMLALALCVDGHAAEARRIAERHLPHIDLPRSRAWALSALSFSAAEEGDYVEAERRGREAVQVVEVTGGADTLPCSIAYQAHASALSGSGDQQAASDAIERAFAGTRTVPGSLHHALTLMIRAKIRIAQRARSYARADAIEARTIVDRYPDVSALSASLAAVQTAAERGGLEALPGSAPTPAERRVLEHLPSALSLAEIADRLYVSRNTTKTHARNLYRRLGVQTRADAVRVARERGLL